MTTVFYLVMKWKVIVNMMKSLNQKENDRILIITPPEIMKMWVLESLLKFSISYLINSLTRPDYEKWKKNLFNVKYKSSEKAGTSSTTSSPFVIKEIARDHPTPKQDHHAPLALSPLPTHLLYLIPDGRAMTYTPHSPSP